MTATSVSPSAAHARPTRLRHEHARALVALAISLPPAIVASFALGLYDPKETFNLPAGMLSWVLWSIAYAGLTFLAFRRATANQLPALVSTRKVRTWQRILAGGADGPGFAVQFAALALASAALLPRIEAFAPKPGEGLLLTILIVTTVATSWIVVTLSYAVHYARIHIATGEGLDFPGNEPPGFFDYLYFSAAVATTFGTTDVDVTNTRLRRVVTGHAVLTFVFNTVIIGLMVSALIS